MARSKFFIILLGLCNFVFGVDVVKLTNGDVLRGEVIGQNTNGQYIQIKFADGNERRIKTSEIEEIKKEDLISPDKPTVITKSWRNTRPGKPLITAGIFTMAITYGLTVGVAAVRGGDTVFIPVIGPFLELSTTNLRAACIASGTLQSVGLGMLLIGLIQNAVADNDSSISLAPLLTPNSTGLNVAYRF